METWETNTLTDRFSVPQIGIFGGSFNPVHNGHLEAINVFKHSLHLDSILLVPSGTSFYKKTLPISFEHRYRMCQLAVQDFPNVEVCDVEREHITGMYTCDMIEAVNYIYSNAYLFFLMGSDVYAHIYSWKGLDKIAGLATIAVIIRSGFIYNHKKTSNIMDKYKLKTLFVQKVNEFSSTVVRAERKNGGRIDKFVPESVANYIYEHHLYI